MAELTKEDFVRVCVRDGMSERNVQAILRNARTIQRLAIASCNENPETHKVEERRRTVERARARVRVICECFPGFFPTFSGDARGHITVITVPSGEYNNMGGEGMAVPHDLF